MTTRDQNFGGWEQRMVFLLSSPTVHTFSSLPLSEENAISEEATLN